MKKFCIIGTVILIVVALVATLLAIVVPAASQEIVSTQSESDQSGYKTVSPVLRDSDSSRTMLGTVISNEIANVYPRREGIVKDVLVDIGDHVRLGQVLAVLLPPGVEGEGSALIGEKQAGVTKSQAQLKSTEAQSQFAIESVQKDVSEKSLAVKNTQGNKDAIIREAASVLATTEKNEDAKKTLARQELESARRDVSELLDQSGVAVSDARRVVELTLVGRNARRSLTELIRSDIPSEFAATNPQFLDQLIEKFNAKSFLVSASDTSSLDSQVQDRVRKLNDANALLDGLRSVLRATVSSDMLSPVDLSDMIKDLNESQQSLLDIRQKLQDGINDLRERERWIGEVDSEAEKNIEAARRQLDTTKTIQESDLRSLKAEFDLLQKQLELKKQEQEQMIRSAQSDVQMARASLSLEYATSGNIRITSPFDGVISKRQLQVGESAQTSQVAFELSNVVTTLSKKAKREIQFGLPEDLREALKVGDTVKFFVPGKEQETFEARVTRKSPKIDDATRTFITRAKLDDSLEIPHNTVIRVRIATTEAAPVYSIPSIAIEREDDRNFIRELMEDGTLRRHEINVLAGEGELSDIAGDITAQMRIVVDPVNITTFDHAQ